MHQKSLVTKYLTFGAYSLWKYPKFHTHSAFALSLALMWRKILFGESAVFIAHL